jgi:hypothetical protein
VPKNKNSFSLLAKIPPPGKYNLFLFAGGSGSSDGSVYEVKSFKS